MNKTITLILFNLCLMFSLNSHAVSQETVDIDVEFNHDMHNINEVIVDLNDEIANKVGRIELIIAANSKDPEVIEINDEIDELSQEMSELGKEFNEDMHEMGKELKGLVKMLRKMGDKESGKGAFLGILLDEHKGGDGGVLLLGVTPDGPAQSAGLQADDIITSINEQSMARDKEMSPASKLYNTMKTVKPGDQLTLLIKRDGKQKTFTFAAGKRGEHLQSGINFLADDLEKRIKTKIHIDLEDEALSGIKLYPVNPKLGNYFGSDKGMLVLEIPLDNKFKLQQGDVILKIGERSPNSSSQTWRILESYDSGETINLTLMRDQQEIKISINKP